MFNLVSGIKGEERVYSCGDVVEFCIGRGHGFKGTLKSIDEMGYIHFGRLSVLENGKYREIEGSIKIHMSEIKEHRRGHKAENFVLMDDKGIIAFLVTEKSEKIFDIGDDICFEVRSDTGKKVFSGVYIGTNDNFICVHNCTMREYLSILGTWSDSIDCNEIKYKVDKIYRMWKKDTKNNKYKVKIIKKVAY